VGQQEILFTRQSGFGPLADIVERDGGCDAVLALFGESVEDLRAKSPLAPVPFSKMVATYGHAAELLDDPLIGVRVGLGFEIEAFGPWAVYLLAAPTLGAAMDRMQFGERLQSNAIRSRVVRAGARVRLELSYRSGHGVSAFQHMLRLQVMQIALLRRFQPDLSSAAEILLTDGDARYARRVSDMLGLPVRAGAMHSGIEFPAAWLKCGAAVAPAAVTNPIDGAYRDAPLPGSVADAVRAVIRGYAEPFECGMANLDAVATLLNVSRRWTQAALQREGVSFRDMLRDARIAHARGLLADTDETLAAVAQLAGYADQSHFHRAFVAVTGVTPHRFRVAARAAAAE